MDEGLLERLAAFSEGGPGQQFPAGRRIVLYRHPRGVGVSAHSREYVELLYMCRGISHHRIADAAVELAEGELLLLGQNTPQELLPMGTDAVAVSFFIKPELFGDILAFLGTEETPLREFVLRCLGQETPYGYLHYHVGTVRQIQNLMENLLLHLLENPESRRPIPLYTVGLLFVQLLEESDKLTMGIREQQTILDVLRYLETNYAGGSLTDAARMLHCDVAWLSREIKRRTGRTYTELLQERRLQQAAWLLTNTKQKVSDIALSVGYENVSYFHRIFQKRFSLSPKKYRDNR
ncbi:MAG: helix-turn-helix transcriptional regulator [Ruminococcaceae bacterium]|nr:helix-turn-helix transcriptional regulator [Oscillospiraceae bacterium]